MFRILAGVLKMLMFVFVFVDTLVTSEIKSCVSLFVKLPLYVSVSFELCVAICLFIFVKVWIFVSSGKWVRLFIYLVLFICLLCKKVKGFNERWLFLRTLNIKNTGCFHLALKGIENILPFDNAMELF